jgi:MFS family permease
VLSFATISSVGRVALAGGAGGILGGLVMVVWGGPRRLRMRGVLLGTFAIAVAAVITGLNQSLFLIGAGLLGMSLSLSVVNGVYATIIQTKVPQRFQGRVIALNTVVAWSTLPLGWAVMAPLATTYAEPLMLAGGPLADTVGTVIGVGPGRGIALVYLVFAACIGLVVMVSLRTRTLSRFDDEVPDAPPDDVVGIEARQARLDGRRRD